MLVTRRQLHGRWLTVAATAIGLLVSLFAPWFQQTVVARGVTGLRTLTVTRSGWQAFAGTEAIVLLVAVLALVLAISRSRPGRPPGRDLVGALIPALGAVAFALLLARLLAAPGTATTSIDETTTAVRWGIYLALCLAGLLTVTGWRLVRRPAAASVTPAAEQEPQATRSRRSPATPERIVAGTSERRLRTRPRGG